MSYECYYCGNIIDNERDHVLKEIPYKKGKEKEIRDFHYDCLSRYIDEYNIKFNEYGDTMEIYDKIYKKIDEFLGYREMRDDDSIPYNAKKQYKNGLTYIARRIKGLHTGKMIPKNENTVARKTGYDYKVIYNTVLYSANEIRTALKNTNKKDCTHEVNLIFYIILRNIDNINYRMIQQSNKNLQELRESRNLSENYNNKINILSDDDIQRFKNVKKQNSNKLIDDLVSIEKEIEEDEFDINDL